MGITTTNPKSKVTKALLPLLQSQMTVVDVGASNGYARIWRAFGEKLSLHGFDPLVTEMQRLQSAEPNPNIQYHSFFVGEEDKTVQFDSDKSNQGPQKGIQSRLATFQAKNIATYDQIKEKFNSGKEIVLSEKMIRLDSFFPEGDHFGIDFIKIDTDGHDINVLRGAQNIISTGGLLGLDVEVRFIGPQGDNANLFRNIDRMLGKAGFSLYHLEPKKYSRAALPRVFVKNRPTISPHGQVRWANAVYLRDLGAPGASERVPLDKVLKSICLFDLYDLPDVSAEIILNERDRLKCVVDPDQLLDLITPNIDGRTASYNEYMDQFRKACEQRRFEDFTRVWID